MLLSLAVTAEAAARQESSARQLSVSPTSEAATRQCTESDLYAGWPRVHHDPLYASARPNPLESLLGCASVRISSCDSDACSRSTTAQPSRLSSGFGRAAA